MQQLLSLTSFFSSLPKAADHRPELDHRSTGKSPRRSAETATLQPNLHQTGRIYGNFRQDLSPNFERTVDRSLTDKPEIMDLWIEGRAESDSSDHGAVFHPATGPEDRGYPTLAFILVPHVSS